MGGLLNATFGNAIEAIVGIIALANSKELVFITDMSFKELYDLTMDATGF